VAAPLPNGQVLIAGGKRGSSFLASAELFNPASDTFTALPASGGTELQTARAGALAAVLRNGQVLIAGGYNRSGYLQRAELCSSMSRRMPRRQRGKTITREPTDPGRLRRSR
jgi:hypothetical protein